MQRTNRCIFYLLVMSTLVRMAMVVLAVVVRAFGVRIIGQGPRSQSSSGLISRTGDTAEPFDAYSHEGLLGTATDTAANERIDAGILQPDCQGFMAGSFGGADFAGRNGPIFYGV